MAAGILQRRVGDIATVLISNPDKLNALTVAMWRELARVMDALSADDELRCVVLRGAGESAFAAGADIAEFATERNDRDQGRQYHRELVYGALRAVAACRHPTVAMIHGPCVGGGLELACQCDLRIAGRSSRYGVPINRLGFAIAYDELEAVLPVIGRAAALEILVEGRVWNAEEAYAKRLVSRLVDDAELETAAYATARRIARRAARRALAQADDPPPHATGRTADRRGARGEFRLFRYPRLPHRLRRLHGETATAVHGPMNP